MRPFDFDHFLQAQEPTYETVAHELQEGRKRTHWMWFIFPQLRGLGQSALSRKYSLLGVDEARAYAEHPVLGARLTECVSWVGDHQDKTAREIFGYPDELKFRSCLTLFSAAVPEDPLYADALAHFFDRVRDPLTLFGLGKL